jgi:predicted anti-sigma-YlaC factor YlaD
MTTEELTCQELVELVTDYLEMALPEGEMARFEEHLAGCRGCRQYLDQMRTTIRLVGRLREVDLSPPARDELLALFRDWKATRRGA